MRKFYDIVENAELRDFGKELGYADVIPIKNLKIAVGGTLEKNRKAVRSRIDVLLSPVTARSREFDTAIARLAAEKKIAIGVSLAQILETQGLDRVRLLRNLRFMVTLCLKMGAEIVILSAAQDRFEMRAPLELASVGYLIGLELPKALWCVSEAPAAILERRDFSRASRGTT